MSRTRCSLLALALVCLAAPSLPALLEGAGPVPQGSLPMLPPPMPPPSKSSLPATLPPLTAAPPTPAASITSDGLDTGRDLRR